MSSRGELRLALLDAAENCRARHATAIVTLRNSGLKFEGKLDKGLLPTVQLRLGHGGWVTFDPDEIAAVESKPAPGVPF